MSPHESNLKSPSPRHRKVGTSKITLTALGALIIALPACAQVGPETRRTQTTQTRKVLYGVGATKQNSSQQEPAPVSTYEARKRAQQASSVGLDGDLDALTVSKSQTQPRVTVTGQVNGPGITSSNQAFVGPRRIQSNPQNGYRSSLRQRGLKYDPVSRGLVPRYDLNQPNQTDSKARRHREKLVREQRKADVETPEKNEPPPPEQRHKPKIIDVSDY